MVFYGEKRIQIFARIFDGWGLFSEAYINIVVVKIVSAAADMFAWSLAWPSASVPTCLLYSFMIACSSPACMYVTIFSVLYPCSFFLYVQHIFAENCFASSRKKEKKLLFHHVAEKRRFACRIQTLGSTDYWLSRYQGMKNLEKPSRPSRPVSIAGGKTSHGRALERDRSKYMTNIGSLKLSNFNR